jgi:hypothetical protein
LTWTKVFNVWHVYAVGPSYYGMRHIGVMLDDNIGTFHQALASVELSGACGRILIHTDYVPGRRSNQAQFTHSPGRRVGQPQLLALFDNFCLPLAFFMNGRLNNSAVLQFIRSTVLLSVYFMASGLDTFCHGDMYGLRVYAHTLSQDHLDSLGVFPSSVLYLFNERLRNASP